VTLVASGTQLSINTHVSLSTRHSLGLIRNVERIVRKRDVPERSLIVKERT